MRWKPIVLALLPLASLPAYGTAGAPLIKLKPAYASAAFRCPVTLAQIRSITGEPRMNLDGNAALLHRCSSTYGSVSVDLQRLPGYQIAAQKKGDAYIARKEHCTISAYPEVGPGSLPEVGPGSYAMSCFKSGIGTGFFATFAVENWTWIVSVTYPRQKNPPPVANAKFAVRRLLAR